MLANSDIERQTFMEIFNNITVIVNFKYNDLKLYTFYVKNNFDAYFIKDTRIYVKIDGFKKPTNEIKYIKLPIACTNNSLYYREDSESCAIYNVTYETNNNIIKTKILYQEKILNDNINYNELYYKINDIEINKYKLLVKFNDNIPILHRKSLPELRSISVGGKIKYTSYYYKIREYRYGKYILTKNGRISLRKILIKQK